MRYELGQGRKDNWMEDREVGVYINGVHCFCFNSVLEAVDHLRKFMKLETRRS